jgi:hypothetical protein
LEETEPTSQSVIAFNDAVGSVSSNKNFELQFTLEDLGSIQFIAYSSANSTDDGVKFTFARTGTLITGIYQSKNITTSQLSFINDLFAQATTPNIHLRIDVHNIEDPTHSLIFPGTGEIESTNIKFNSQTAEHYSSNSTPTGKASGTYWAIVLNKATLTKAKATDSKYTD